MNKLETVEKDNIQTSEELDVNNGVHEIHKEQNNRENLPIENVESKEINYHSLEIEQESESEQSDENSQENSVLGELSGIGVELEKVESIIDRLNVEDSTESSNENDQSEPADNTPIKEQNVVDEIHDEKIEEGLKQEEENHKELSFDEIVNKILTKEIKTNKDFRRVIEG